MEHTTLHHKFLHHKCCVLIPTFNNAGSIKAVIEDMLNQFQIWDVHIIARDKGALELVIRARVETAISRALGN